MKMNKRCQSILGRSVTLAAIVLFAMAAVPIHAEPPGEADHEELREMLITVTSALNEGKLDSLQPILTEDFVFTTSDQKTFTKLSEAKEHWKLLFESGDYPLTSLKVDPTATIETKFIDDNNGYCYGKATETYTLKGGKEIELASSWTGTVTKVDGKWKLATAHVGIHFFENAVVEALGSSAKWLLIGGLVAGVLIGLVIAKLIGAKKGRTKEATSG